MAVPAPIDIPSVPTPYALKYGPASPRHQFNRSVLKSHITPVLPLHPSAPPFSPNTILIREYSEHYQRSLLKGYTVYQLYHINAISEAALTPCSLDNPIHHLLARHRWTSRPKTTYEVDPKVGGGQFVATNDVVWNVLTPALRLASWILAYVHMHPWVESSISLGCKSLDSM